MSQATPTSGADPNQAHWEAIAERWINWSQRFNQLVQPLADWMLSQAAAAPGSRVLDIATGIGEPAFAFARAVGPAGFVLGLDQSSQMIAHARQKAQTEQLTQLDFVVQDMEQLALTGQAAFDVVSCRCGLMFAHDKQALLQRLRQHLKPGGRLVAVVWAEAMQAPFLSLAGQVFSDQFAQDVSRPGPSAFSLSDPDLMLSYLKQAGFAGCEYQALHFAVPVQDAEHYFAERCQTAPQLEQAVQALTVPERQQFFAALQQALQPWQQAQGFLLQNQLWGWSAYNPG